METYGILTGLAYVVLAFVVLLVAKIIKDFLTPYRLDAELTGRDNPAIGLTLAGYFAGVIIIYLGATVGDEALEPLPYRELAAQVGIDFLYALGGIFALNLGRWVVDKLVLTSFSTVKEIITDRNTGTAAVEAGAFIATALIIAGSISGEVLVPGEEVHAGTGPLAALAFFALGQVVLVLFGRFYQWITRYDVHAEIERDNVAAGVAFGANLVAIGIVLFGATSGDFTGWGANLLDFGYFALLGFVLLLVLRKATDFVLLPGTTLAEEIARDRNINAAWIEGVVNMGMAVVIIFMI